MTENMVRVMRVLRGHLLKLTHESPGDFRDYGWHAYDCTNEVQSAVRLVRISDGCEIQLNWLLHSERPHCHSPGTMASFMLIGGYEWFLQQHGAAESLKLVSAAGSLVTMNPTDTHWIPRRDDGGRSLSMCVFDHVTDWHERYPSVPVGVAIDVHQDAVSSARFLKGSFPDV